MQKKEKNEHSSFEFLKSIYQHCNIGAYLNLRFLPSAENKFVSLEKINTIPFIVSSHRNQNCYFGVGTRKDGDGSKEGIDKIPSLWCDVDIVKGDAGYDEFVQVYKNFPLKPSILVETGGGYHLYWLLKEPSSKNDIPRIENLLKRISFHLGGDLAATDASRILRLPGTWNLKYSPKRKVTIGHLHPAKQYNLDDFEILAPIMETSTKEERPYSQETSERLNQIMECGFLKHCDTDRQILSEPEWYSMVSVLAREPGGPNLIHRLSKGYPKYSPTETDKKILHAINDAGPATCERIKMLCDCGKDCRVKSPASLVFGKIEKKRDSGHHFNLIWAKDVVNIQEPEREWIWEGILISGGSSLIVAKPKIGKTTLALQLAVAVSRGDIFLGRKTRQATVVYLALEEHRDEVQKNLSKLGVTDEPLLIHFGPAPAQAMREVESLIRETGAKLLVIDILQKFCRVKDLNDYSQVTRTLEPLMAAGRNLDCQISLTHHAGKKDREDGDDILGSTGLLGGVDTSIHIKKRNKESRILSTIQRYGTDVPQTVVALRDGCLAMEGSREEVEIGETVPLILEALGEGSLAEKDIWARVEKGHSCVSSALRKLVEQRAVIRTGTGKRGNPFIYEKDSLLLSSYIYEEGGREMKAEANPLESRDNISPDDFQKNQLPQERIKRVFPAPKKVEEDPSKGGLYEVLDDGQLTY